MTGLLRWMLFCYRVKYVPGKEISVADALSRTPVSKGVFWPTKFEVYVSIVTVAGLPVPDFLSG